MLVILTLEKVHMAILQFVHMSLPTHTHTHTPSYKICNTPANQLLDIYCAKTADLTKLFSIYRKLA